MKTMHTHKDLAPIIWVIIAALVLGGGYVAVKKLKVSSSKEENSNTAEPLPITPTISTVTPDSGPIGVTIELKGYNLLDNRGNQNLIIENAKGETASFGFGNPEHLNLSQKYVSMKFTLNDKVCKQWATDMGGPCTKGWMILAPGEYKIYVARSGFTDTSAMSNKVKFTITGSETANWKTYRNDKYGFEFRYPTMYALADYNVPKTAGIIVESNYVALVDLNKNARDSEPISFIAVGGISQSLKEFAEYAYEYTKTKGHPPAQVGSLEKIAVAGGGGFAFTCRGMCSVAPQYGFLQSDISKKILFVEKRDDVVFVVYMTDSDLYKEILSTFKFTDNKNTLTDLKMYTNPEYGITFSYPAKYRVSTPPGYTEAILPLFFYKDPAKHIPDFIDVRWLPFKAPDLPPEQTLINDVVFDGSGTHPKSFDSFTFVHLGDNDFYKIRTGLFEGVLGYRYYILRDDGAFVFTLTSNAVPWTDPLYDSEKDPRHLDLQEILKTVKLNN